MATAAKLKSGETRARLVTYPTRDGKPFAESDWHFEAMADTLTALDIHFEGRPDVYVSGNNFVYWEEGNPKARISPDVYVVFGIPGHLRDCYMSWEEGGRLPSVILEATSRQTRREDINKKLPLYEQVWKTPEIFFFDPTGDYLRPRLQGYRLVNGRYVRLELAGDRLHSERLGLDLVQEGERLRLWDPIRLEYLPTPQELSDRAKAAAQHAEAEARRAEAETRRAEAETRRAEAEAKARRDAETENARLRAELDALKEKNAQGT